MAAGRAVVVAEVADVRGGELVRPAAPDAVARVGRVLQRRPGVCRIVDRRRRSLPARSRPRSPTCGSSPLTTSTVSSGKRRDRRPPVGGDVLQLAVAVELVAEEVAEQHRARAARAARSRAARPRPPRRAPARRRAAVRSVDATPEARFAPERLQRETVLRLAGSRRPWRWSSSCRWWRRRSQRRPAAGLASASIALGSSFQSSLPGSVVPPPVPARRESFPAARAARDSTARRALIRGREYRLVPRTSELRPAYSERVRKRHPITHTVMPVSSRPDLRCSTASLSRFMRLAPSADKEKDGKKTGGNCGDVRQSALWGSGNRGGEFRSNALWGKGGRGGIATLVRRSRAVIGSGAASAKSTAPQPAPSVTATVVEPGLPERAKRIRTRGSASSSRARSAPRRRSLRSILQRRPTTSSFRATRRSLRTTRSWPTRRTRSTRRRRIARGLRPSVTVGVHDVKRRRRSESRLAVSSTTGSTSSTASRWRCPAGGSSGSLAWATA